MYYKLIHQHNGRSIGTHSFQHGLASWTHSTVTEVVAHSGRVTVVTADGATWPGSHVVGADGARSTVRKRTGASLEGHAAEGFHVVVDVADEPGGTPSLERVMHSGSPDRA
ncbi:FAD binding domain-containing protein [Lentzea atacamensis]|uniref:FAD binding domain-containing protein n=1 Tax=Lentzea atacamensis TaxID=531938 RepID=A0ABX9EAI0_9PSEU|nr:FAD-dependent monooxygenase [Lentzea atacamensis]RAS67165.1 FAD binding domain-containing protein [Lentzea atacamensis]